MANQRQFGACVSECVCVCVCVCVRGVVLRSQMAQLLIFFPVKLTQLGAPLTANRPAPDV